MPPARSRVFLGSRGPFPHHEEREMKSGSLEGILVTANYPGIEASCRDEEGERVYIQLTCEQAESLIRDLQYAVDEIKNEEQS